MNGPGGPAAVIYQCLACRSLVAASTIAFDRERDRAGLVCSHCGAASWLPLAGTAGARVVDVDPPPTERARGGPRELPAPAGLVPSSTSMVGPLGVGAVEVFSVDQRERITARCQTLPPAPGAQAELAQAFERLLPAWGSDAEHKQLLKRASMLNELAFVGQRYRLVLEEAPGDPAARRAQNEILSLAMASLSQTRDLGSPAEGSRSRAGVAAAIVLLVLALIGALVVMPRLLRGMSGEAMIDAPPGASP